MHTLSFPLDQASLAPFREALQRATQSQKGADPAALMQAAEQHMQSLQAGAQPAFVRERLAQVPTVMAMLRDGSWQPGEAVRAAFAGALAYLAEPQDLIPDDHPRYGLLDDALVLDIALATHRPEWLAWQEYDAFRQRHFPGERLERAEWLALRRQLRRWLRHGEGDGTVFRGQGRGYLARGGAREGFKVH